MVRASAFEAQVFRRAAIFEFFQDRLAFGPQKDSPPKAVHHEDGAVERRLRRHRRSSARCPSGPNPPGAPLTPEYFASKTRAMALYESPAREYTRRLCPRFSHRCRATARDQAQHRLRAPRWSWVYGPASRLRTGTTRVAKSGRQLFSSVMTGK
jgi:hypothetical protein